MHTAATEKTRVFIGLYPSPDVRAQLWQLAGEIVGSGRRVPNANLHMTIRFVGYVNAHQQGVLQAAVESFAWRPFDMVLDRLGYWPKRQLVFAAPRQRHAELVALHTNLQTALADSGFVKCTRDFQPHITLARRVPHRPRHPSPSIHWRCERLVLMQSTLHSSGSVYKELASAPVLD